MKRFSFTNWKKILTVFVIAFFMVLVLWIFSVGKSRLTELRSNRILGATKRQLLNDIVAIQKNMNLDFHLGWKIKRDIQKIVDKSQNHSKPHEFIHQNLKQLFNNSFYASLPGFSMRVYDFDVQPNYGNHLLSKKQLIERYSMGGQLDSVLEHYMMLSNLKNLADKVHGYDLILAIRKCFKDNFDRNSFESYSNLSKAATGKFNSVYVKGKEKRYFWSPLFHSNWINDTKRLGKMDLLNGDPRNLNFVYLLGAISVVFDSEKMRPVEEEVLLKLAIENYAEEGLELKFMKTLDHSLQKNTSRQSQTSNFFQVKEFLVTEANFLLKQPVSGLLARRLENAKDLEGSYSPLLFTLICFWAAVITWATGCFFVMGKKVSSGLKTQVSMIIFILLFPPTLLGWEMMERYLEEKEQGAVLEIRRDGLQGLRDFEAGLGMYKSWICAEMNEFIKDSELKNQLSLLKPGVCSESEKKKLEMAILKRISDYIFAFGVHIKNIMILRVDNYAISLFTGNEGNDKRFLTNFCSTLFLDALRKFNPGFSPPKGRQNLLLEAQTDELLGYFKTFLPERILPFAGQTMQSLDQIRGWGRQAQIYHRFFSLKDNIDHVFQTSIYFPSIYRQFFRDWADGARKESLHSSVRLIGLKGWDNWFLRYPFWKSQVGENNFSMTMLYDYFPEQFARAVYSAGKIGQPVVNEIKWGGKKWLLFVQASKEADEHSSIILVPLNEVLHKLKTFRTRVQFLIIAVFVLAIFLGGKVAAEILKPIQDLSVASKSIVEGNFSQRIDVENSDKEIQELGIEFNRLAESVESGQFLKKFVAETAFEMVRSEIDNAESIKPASEDAVIMFVHMADFKNALTNLPAQKSLKCLNDFFQQVCQIVNVSGGEINKFIGEKVLIVFYTRKFQSHQETAIKAIECARMVSRVLIEELYDCGCKVKVGVAAGNIQSGIIGVKEIRQEQTVIGDKVNLSARLCAIKQSHNIAVDIALKDWISQSNLWDELFKQSDLLYSKVKVKGKNQEISIFSFS